MDFIPCLPIFVNPIAKTVFFFENQQWCTGNGPELGLRNSAFKSQILPSMALWHWTNHALYPNALIYEDLLQERTTFFFLSEPSEPRAWPTVWRPILRWLLMCLLFNFHKDSAVFFFFFFFALERKNEERKKQEEREKKCQRLKGMNILCT